MNRAWARHGLTLGLVSLLGACIPEYHPPSLAEPHATLKIRRTYEHYAGTTLRERLLVDDHSALSSQVPAGLSREARIDSSLVYPTPATFVMTSSFFHQEMQQVQETYYEQEMYMDSESYDCSSGFGTSAVHRSCSRMVTRYRPITRYRWVSRLVDVTDAECSAQSRFSPAAEHVYLLQYTFQEHRACSLSCFEQLPNPDGTFTNATCPAAPIPQ
jgi:hypothetical protein